MLYDAIFDKIHKVDPLSESMKVAQECREAFLRSWLNQYPRKPKSPEMDALAHEIALVLAGKESKLVAAISLELTYSPSMGLLEADSEFTVEKITLPAQPTPQDLVDFKKSHIQAIALAKAKKDFEANKSNPKKFLAERKNTRTDQGHTADPYSPANLFCARVALSLVDQNAPNPREQFWKLLYPELKHVILGYRDSDWPNYGEALLAGNDLINYRKLALMAQDREVLKLLLNQEGAVKEGIFPKSLKAYPHYRSLSQDEISAVKKFNHEEDYWENSQSNQLGANAFEFFTNLKNVLDRFRAGRSGNAHLESEMSAEGLDAIRPYLEYMNRSTIMNSLERLKKTLPRQATELHVHVDYLKGISTLMKNYHHSCFDSAYGAIGKALEKLGEHLIALSLEERETVTWNNQILGHDSCPPADLDKAVMESCLKNIHDKKMLFEWIKLESIQGTPMPVKTVVNRFRELSSTMTVTEIYNFIYEHFPKGEDIVFADQQGKEQSAAYSDSFFINELFKNGFREAQLKTIKDCQFALKLHVNYGVKGKHLTLERAIDLVATNDRYPSLTHFNEIREIYIEVMGDQEISEVRLFQFTDRMNLNLDKGVLASLFHSINLGDFEKMARCYSRRYRVERSSYLELMNGFEKDHIDENVSDNLTFLSAGIFRVLRRMSSTSSVDRKKILILFSEFLPMLQGPYKGNFHLPQLANLLRKFDSQMQLDMGLIFCMKALERRTIEDNHFAYALGLTLNLLIDASSVSAMTSKPGFNAAMTDKCFCSVRNLLQMHKSPIKDPKDSIDRTKNQFIEKLNELIMNLDPVQFSILLSSIEPAYRKGFIELFSNDIARAPLSMDVAQWLDCVKTLGSKTLRFTVECMPIRVKTSDELMKLASSLDVHDLAPYISMEFQFQIHSVDEWLDLCQSLGPYSKALLDSFLLQDFILSRSSVFEPIKTLLHFLSEANFKFMIDQGRLDCVFDQIKTVAELEKILSGILVGENPSLENHKITAVLKACKHIYYDQLIDLANKTHHMQSKRAIVYSTFFLFKKESNLSYRILRYSNIFERINALDEVLGKAALDGVISAINLKGSHDVAADITSYIVEFFRGLRDADLRTHLWLGVNQTILDPGLKRELNHGLVLGFSNLNEMKPEFLKKLKEKLQGKSIMTVPLSPDQFLEIFEKCSINERSCLCSMLTSTEVINLYIDKHFCDLNIERLLRLISEDDKRKALLYYELHRVSINDSRYAINPVFYFDNNLRNSVFPLLADILARYKAIYELLVNESEGGRFFHLGGTMELQNLALNDFDGWKAFFKSTALRNTQSMRFQAWEVARVYDLDARVIKLEEAIKNLRARGNVGLGLFTPLFRSQRTPTQELTPETMEAILQACCTTAGHYYENSTTNSMSKI